MATKRTKPNAKPAPQEPSPDTGLPGGGKGRRDEVGRTGVYPGSGPYPSGPAEVRTPAEFVHGQTDAEGRQAEGSSGLTYFHGETLLGGASPTSSSPPDAQPPGDAATPPSRKAAAKKPRAGRAGSAKANGGRAQRGK